MKITAHVFRVEDESGFERQNLGDFVFHQSPAQGDRINLTHGDGKLGMYKVLYVVHEPLRPDEIAEPDFLGVSVAVTFLRDLG